MNNSSYNNDDKTNYESENKALQMILQNRYKELRELAENIGLSTANPGPNFPRECMMKIRPMVTRTPKCATS